MYPIWNPSLVSTENKFIVPKLSSSQLSSSLHSLRSATVDANKFNSQLSERLCSNKSASLLLKCTKNKEFITSPSATEKRKHEEKSAVSVPKRPLLETRAKSLSLENQLLKGIEVLQNATISDDIHNFIPQTLNSEEKSLTADIIRISHLPDKQNLYKGPEYKFSSVIFEEPEEEKFEPVEKNAALTVDNRLKEIESIKSAFLMVVSTSLLHVPNFKNKSDETRKQLINYADAVCSIDPEFLLKVALYARQELNIRSTANFILAYAAYCESCRPFLKKYFSASICLPSDWIDVAENYLIFEDSRSNFRSLPSCLRKVMKSSFCQFDQYQFAKYDRNKEKNQKKKAKNKRRIETNQDPQQEEELDDEPLDQMLSNKEEKENLSRKFFTLKQLIRLLHITKPAEIIMCLLGKKYPSDIESFKRSGLPGDWDRKNAGNRMKLPTPETWETEISLKGNKASVWEALIDHKKLPYMAMLRNLRNILLSGISEAHHTKVIHAISKHSAVINSRQFPIRFCSAYSAIEELQSLLEIFQKEDLQCWNKHANLKKWQIKQRTKLYNKIQNYDENLLNKYKTAIDKAVEISTLHNLDPISGQTLVICDLVTTCKLVCPALKDNPTQFNKLHHGILMLGMMFLYACESCDMKVITGKNSWKSVSLSDDSILSNVHEVLIDCEIENVELEDKDEISFIYKTLSNLLDYYLQILIMQKKKLDNVIFLTVGEYFEDSVGPEIISSFLKRYRHLANPDLFYVQVDLTGSSSSKKPYLSNEKDVHLCGFSDQLLRFVSKSGSSGQLSHVENIDQKYNLKHIYRPSLSTIKEVQTTSWLPSPSNCQPVWRTLRVFISSTFKDMHGERDVLVRYVFPELRARSQSLCINIHEIDLRWGITEAEGTNFRSLELCLSEVYQCHFFIGILGQRYGQTLEYNLPDSPQFDWVRNYPPGASVTELEMHCGALCNPEDARERAFFYLRDNSFISNVPNEWKQDFLTEHEAQMEKINNLKHRIRNSGIEVYDGYPCEWGGFLNGCPFVNKLEDFGQKVLDNLWNAICKLFPKDDITEEFEERNIHTLFAQRFQNFCGRELLIKKCINDIKTKDGVFLIAGHPGCGKTALLAHLSQKIKFCPVFAYFFGITPYSTEVVNILYSMIKAVCSYFSIPCLIPDTLHGLMSQFCSILKKGVEASSSGCIILIIDGLDHLLDVESQHLDWLPYSFPTGVKLLCSASTNSKAFCELNEKAKTGLVLHTTIIDPLMIAERQNMVRNHLKHHSKSLDESPFNNQLLLLVTKQDAGYPLYLHLACEELRTFNIYEKVTEKIRSLPSNSKSLLLKMISELEILHRKEIIQSALCFLTLAKEGLEEHELKVLLSIRCSMPTKVLSFNEIAQNIYDIKLENLLTPLSFGLLLHSLKGFLCPIGEKKVLKLAFAGISKIVTIKYFGGMKKKEIKFYHMLLAGYFLTLADPNKNKTWKGQCVRFFRGFLHHLAKAECYKDLSDVLCTLGFLEASMKVGLVNKLLDCFQMLRIMCIENNWIHHTDRKKIEDYYFFISSNMHILNKYPCLVQQQALNCHSTSSVYSDVQEVPNSWIIDWITKPHYPDPCYLTLSDFAEPVLCVASLPNRNVAAIGNQDGSSKLIDFQNGKVLKTFTGHSNSVIAICFVGSEKLCTASTDNTLCLWDIVKGIRLAVLTGHKLRASSCCSNPSGNIIVSGSWDRSIRLWSGIDGREISCITNIKRPVSCVCFHPERQSFASGSWDKTIVIWDALSLGKIAVLKGHSGPVHSLTISSDGLHIMSSSSSGEVFCWSFFQHVKVAKLMDHNLGINQISYSLTDDFLIAANSDWTIKVWTTKTAKISYHLPNINSSLVCLMEFMSFDSLAIAYEDGMLAIFDFHKNNILCKCIESSYEITCLNKYYDSQCRYLVGVIFGTSQGSVKILKLTHNESINLGIMSASVTAIIECSSLVIAGSVSGDIAIFDQEKRSCISVYNMHCDAIITFGLSSKKHQIISCGVDKKLNLWIVNKNWKQDSNPLCYKKCLNHHEVITACCYSNDFLVLGCDDATISIKSKGHDICKGKGLGAPAKFITIQEKYIYAGGIDGSFAMFSKSGCLLNILQAPNKNLKIPVAHIFIKETIDSDNEEIVYQALVASFEQHSGITIRKPFSDPHLTALQGHKDSVMSACMSTKNSIVSCSLDKSLRFWTLPELDQEHVMQHRGAITAIGTAMDQKVAFSSDCEGTLVMWNISSHGTKPISNIKYNQGCIITALWIPSRSNLMCCITQNVEEISNFVEFISFESLDRNNTNTLLLKKKDFYPFNAEILCADYFSTDDLIAICTKDGNACFFNSDFQVINKTSFKEWILTAKFSDKFPTSLFMTTASGKLMCHKISTFAEALSSSSSVISECAWSSSLLILSNDVCLIGDNSGRLSIYKDGNKRSWKIHTHAITCMCINENFLFTSSKDSTIKVWEIDSMQQVGMFHSPVPVCKMTTYIPKRVNKEPITLLCGTVMGDVHVLLWKQYKENYS